MGYKAVITDQVEHLDSNNVVYNITKGSSSVVNSTIPTDFQSIYTDYKDTAGTSITISNTYKDKVNTFISSNWSSTSTADWYIYNLSTTPVVTNSLVSATSPYVGISINTATSKVTVYCSITAISSSLVTSLESTLATGANTITADLNSSYKYRLVFNYVPSALNTCTLTSLIIYPTATGFVAPDGNTFTYTVTKPNAINVIKKYLKDDNNTTTTTVVDIGTQSMYVTSSSNLISDNLINGGVLFVKGGLTL